MAWRTTDLLGASIADVDSSAAFPLGTKCTGRDTSTGYTGEFVYMKGAASVAVGSWCLLNYDNGTVSLLVDADKGGVGVATAATVASTYGWFQIRGKNAAAKAIAGGSCADNAQIFTTATAGSVDDVATGQYYVTGARCAGAEASSSGTIEVELHYPTVHGPDGA